jgi:hypothetical protein
MRRRGKEQPVFPIHQGLVELAGRSSPGLSHEQFVKALERWAEAGMLCPAN